MIRYLFTRIKNKYKLYLCLVFGIMSMVMVFSLIMMFKNGSLNKLIQNGFISSYKSSEGFPAVIYSYEDHKKVNLLEIRKDKVITDEVTKSIEKREKEYIDAFNLPVISIARKVYYLNAKILYGYGNKTDIIDLGYLEDGLGSDIKDHYTIEEGADLYEDISSFTKDGAKIDEDAYPVLVCRSTADSLNLVIGEQLSFPDLFLADDPENENAPKLKIYVSGIIDEKKSDYFWDHHLSDMGLFFIMDKKDFEKAASDYTREIKSDSYIRLDYRYIDSTNLKSVLDASDLITESGKKKNVQENISPVLKQAETESISVRQMLYVIILPLVVLIYAFIGMIAFRIVDSESGELRTLRDRGLGKGRLIGTHILLSLILAFMAIPFGVILSYFFGRLVAGVDDFCGFSFGSNAVDINDYVFTPSMIAAGCIAALSAVIVNVIPVILFFGKNRNKRRVKMTPSYEKYLLDIILLSISVYLLINYNRQLSSLSINVLKGEGIDPVIFIDSTLFLFACGLLMLRLIFYMIRFIFWIGKDRFPAVIFAGIVEIMRTRSTSGVISVFLVVTVAMSVFNANMARTINLNRQARTQYDVGADIRINEHWELMLKGPDSAHLKWKYSEPDFGVYEDLLLSGYFEKITKVGMDERSRVEMSKEQKADNVKLMAINTKEFGQIASLKDGLNKEHWYNYLNALAKKTNGVIISSNMAEKLQISVGDKVIVYRYPPEVMRDKDPYAQSILEVVAICDAFPGYNRYAYEEDNEGNIKRKEKYLAVMNFAESVGDFGMMPYEVWGKSDKDVSEIREALKEGYAGTKRYASSVISMEEELKNERSTAIIQITNGLFTADFLVALLLCVIGYMIYWITSIRDRGLLFGVCRAMGITGREIDAMLIIEQVFLSFMSIMAGVFAGSLTSKLFMKVFSTVYLPMKHNIDVFSVSYVKDISWLLFVLSLVIIFCMIWIRRIVGRLNISQAIKLGED